jgi:two-component system chemotaxis response regulator CheB
MKPARPVHAIVAGGSAGALDALATILPALPAGFALPIAVVLHVPPSRRSHVADVLAAKCALLVKEADDKEPFAPSTVYVAPPNYHLLIEPTFTLALSVDDPVLFSRPSIDVLFESAADAYGPGLVGVLLSGANEDGARGLARIEEAGGTTIVQSPRTALVPTMPEAALGLTRVDRVLPLDEMGPYLARLGARGVAEAEAE